MGISIGIVNISYQCNPTLELAFNSWREIKNGALKGLIDNVWISSKHVCFPETASLNYPLYSEDGTLQTLEELEYRGVIDDLLIYNKPIEEQIAWSDNLPFLQSKNPDIIFMVNSDEIWTLQEIERVIRYLNRNTLTDYFKINFKNYFGRGKYVKDFIAPRIWSNRRNGGIKRFYCDDLVEFNNGKKDIEVSHMIIPQKICFPAHYSWSLPPQFSDKDNKLFCMRKLGFQKCRYHFSSYRWDEKSNQLELDPNYYARIGKPIPEIFYEENLVCKE